MGSITFDRFDGGLLLARPSSVAPANSLANLFNMDVQPGGWLRSRASWRRTPLLVNPSSEVKGLYSNGGRLWSFALSIGQLPVDNVTASGPQGYRYVLDTQGAEYCIGVFNPGAVAGTLRLAGVAPWSNGFVVVMRDLTANAWLKAMFTVNDPGGIVTRADITDGNMPNSGIMCTIGSRIFAASDDGRNVRFCAINRDNPTAGATDWSTASNAGFFSASLHFGGGSRVYALGAYQGKLVVFTEASIQIWNVEAADPTGFALENVISGVGTRHHGSVQSVNGDLLFLSDSGVRSLTTLQNEAFPSSVDIGLPVNALAKAPDLTLEGTTNVRYSKVLSCIAQPFGQYWVASPDTWTFGGASEYGWLAWTFSRTGKVNAWAWHGAGGTPRAKLTGVASLGTSVYARTNKEDFILRMTPDVFTLDQTQTGAFAGCAMTTQWLDFGKPGKRKTLTGIDFDGVNVATVSILVSVGGDRTGVLAESVPVGSNQGGWTYSGEVIPLQTDGTEFRLSFSGTGLGEVQLNRFTLHFEELAA